MNNEALARVYDPDYTQIICVWPLVWRHAPGGDWFLDYAFPKTPVAPVGRGPIAPVPSPEGPG